MHGHTDRDGTAPDARPFEPHLVMQVNLRPIQTSCHCGFSQKSIDFIGRERSKRGHRHSTRDLHVLVQAPIRARWLGLLNFLTCVFAHVSFNLLLFLGTDGGHAPPFVLQMGVGDVIRECRVSGEARR